MFGPFSDYCLFSLLQEFDMLIFRQDELET